MDGQFAIVRIGKIKDPAALKGHAGHVLRTIPTPNADASHPRGVVRLFGDGDPRQVVESAIQGLGKPPRKGGVLALEVLLTASPGWLREGLQPGQYHHDRVKTLAEAAKGWAAKTFPGCPMVAHLHLDESTPHIHLTVVPIDQSPSAKGKASGPRLNAARWVDGPDKLRKIQDSWAEALAPWGLKRGQPSDRRHKTVQEMYRSLEADKEAAAKILKTSKKVAAETLNDAEEQARETMEKAAAEAAARRAQVEAAAARYIERTKETAAGILAKAAQEADADRQAASADREAAAADRRAAAAERKAAEQDRAEARRLLAYLTELVDRAAELRVYLADAGKLAAARLKAQIARVPGRQTKAEER
jgi:hypothetical protein